MSDQTESPTISRFLKCRFTHGPQTPAPPAPKPPTYGERVAERVVIEIAANLFKIGSVEIFTDSHAGATVRFIRRDLAKLLDDARDEGWSEGIEAAATVAFVHPDCSRDDGWESELPDDIRALKDKR